MRLVIECIERVGVAQEILGLLAAWRVNLEGIELQKSPLNGAVFVKTEPLNVIQKKQIMREIEQLQGVIAVKSVPFLPQEGKNAALRALLESLPHPVLSLDAQGRIEFANQQAVQLLLPVYRQMQPKKKQAAIQSLHGVALNDILLNLNKTKWYRAFLENVAQVQTETVQPICHPLQFQDQIWHIDMLPLELWEAQANTPLGCVVTLQSQQNMQIDVRYFMAQQTSEFDHIIAKNKKMLATIEQAKKFAISDAPLLIQGETGTGKDLFAKACHHFSFRRRQKFIAVNCAGLPPSEAETEMFGYGKDTVGFFEYANGGTVLLDSVAELSLEMQAKLLRFLNDGSFRRVGEDREIHSDVRVICTSQVPLAHYVSEGKMREDLFHRLNVLTLHLPPLRERLDDVPLLARRFVQQVSQQLGIQPPRFDEEVVRALQAHRWSGNLRELYNALYRACSLSANQQLTVTDLGLPQENLAQFDVLQDESRSLDELVSRFEENLLRQFYAQFPSTRKLAQRLGISHTAVANKLRVYGIGK